MYPYLVTIMSFKNAFAAVMCLESVVRERFFVV